MLLAGSPHTHTHIHTYIHTYTHTHTHTHTLQSSTSMANTAFFPLYRVVDRWV
jgi:hypothetical protein